MNTYDMVFGDGYSGIPFLVALGFKKKNQVGKYRTAWLEKDENDVPRIAVYTRNGGENRSDYMPDLSEHPCYLHDIDDTFDSTYATIYFSIPEGGLKEAIEEKGIEGIQAAVDTSDRWHKAIDNFRISGSK